MAKTSNKPDFLIMTTGGPFVCYWKNGEYWFERSPEARSSNFEFAHCILPAIENVAVMSMRVCPDMGRLRTDLYVPPVYQPEEIQALFYPPQSTQKVRGLYQTNTLYHPNPLNDTFLLNSIPGANHTIYLDFNGHTTSGTIWNSFYTGGNNFVTPAYNSEGTTATFTDTELARIQQIWSIVAEDFAPFNVNVTTQDPGIDKLGKANEADTQWGVRVCIGGSSMDWYGAAVGGIAFVGSFNLNNDTPVYVFPAQLGGGTNTKYIADAVSHEAGHALGLDHHGRTSPVEEFYYGLGSGESSWAPIMGSSYTRTLATWSDGSYANASRPAQNDVDIISSVGQNGFGYIAATAGGTRETASEFPAPESGTSYATGIIRLRTESNFYHFVSTGQNWAIVATNHFFSPNLDILLELQNDQGTVLQTSNSGTLNQAEIVVTNLAAGDYYVRITGASNSNMPSDYGSLGNYTIGLTPQSYPYAPPPPSLYSYNKLFGLGTHSQDATLRGWWKLQETTGTTATDSSTNAVSGTINGMGANPVTTTGPRNWLSSAFNFDGNGDWIDFGNPAAVQITGAITLMAWVKPTLGAGPNVSKGILSKYTSPDQRGYALWNDRETTTTDKARFIIIQDGATYSANGDINNGTNFTSDWQHIAGAFVPSTSVTLYRNGSVDRQLTSSIPSAIYNNNQPATIGTGFVNTSTDRQFHGGIAGAAMFAKALTADEIADAYNGPEPTRTGSPTLSFGASTWTGSIGTFSDPSNGAITYEWQLRRTSDDYIVQDGTGSSPSGSNPVNGTYYLWSRASNTGGYDSAEDGQSGNVVLGGEGPPPWAVSRAFFHYMQQG